MSPHEECRRCHNNRGRPHKRLRLSPLFDAGALGRLHAGSQSSVLEHWSECHGRGSGRLPYCKVAPDSGCSGSQIKLGRARKIMIALPGISCCVALEVSDGQQNCTCIRHAWTHRFPRNVLLCRTRFFEHLVCAGGSVPSRHRRSHRPRSLPSRRSPMSSGALASCRRSPAIHVIPR